MNTMEQIKNLRREFFKKKNLESYYTEYRHQLNKIATHSVLWKYIINIAWKLDHKVFIDDTINQLYYTNRLSELFNKVYSINKHFSLIIYILYNTDFINKLHYVHEYLEHYINIGSGEKRLCDITSCKSFKIDYFITNNIGLCDCIFDYIHYFNKNIDVCVNYTTNINNNTTTATTATATAITTNNNNNNNTNTNKYVDIHITCIKIMKIVKHNKEISKTIIDEQKLINIITKILNDTIYKTVPNIVDNNSIDSKIKNLDWSYSKQPSLPIAKKKNNMNDCHLYKEYPFIFHKYLLKLSIPYYNMKYKIHNDYIICTNNEKSNLIVIHMHCFNIDHFDMMYGSYITLIKQHFSVIIITYSCGTINYDFNNNNMILIKTENKGMDIGGKIIAMDYLRSVNIKFRFIFFLQSKSDVNRRNNYFQPFFNNMDFIMQSINKVDHNYLGYFPPIILNGDYHFIVNNNNFEYNTNKKTDRDVRNKTTFNEFCTMLELDKNLIMFPEGNNYILSYDIANEMFNPLYYHLLNKIKSFDAHWVMVYYGLFNQSISDIYTIYKNKMLYGNNLETGLGHKGLADSQIEHVFERIVFNLIQKKKGYICILPYSSATINKTKYLENTINYSYLYGDYKISNRELLMSNHIRCVSNNILTIIACHTNSTLKIQSLIHNIGQFLKISTHIIICNSNEFKQTKVEEQIRENYPNDSSKILFEYIKNDHFVCHNKWHKMIEKYKHRIHNYTQYILTNDSYLFIDNMETLAQKININYEMQSILISNEGHRHYTDFFRCYNYGGLLKINNYYKNFIDINTKSLDFIQIIQQLEMKSHEIFYKACGLFEEKDPINIHFIEPYKRKYIVDTNYPIIKLKAINTTIYTSSSLPYDFDELNYRSLHPDLFHITEKKDLANHFTNNGYLEGRLYKRGQKVILPQYIYKYLINAKITI